MTLTKGPSRYRKKPVEIDAMQHDGSQASADRVVTWVGAVAEAMRQPWNNDYWDVHIKTLEGVMTAGPFDWIIRGVKGEHYPCKPDIFDATYEKA